jgi:hypothetical protein
MHLLCSLLHYLKLKAYSQTPIQNHEILLSDIIYLNWKHDNPESVYCKLIWNPKLMEIQVSETEMETIQQQATHLFQPNKAFSLFFQCYQLLSSAVNKMHWNATATIFRHYGIHQWRNGHVWVCRTVIFVKNSTSQILQLLIVLLVLGRGMMK